MRVRAQITPKLTALAGVFDGDPLGNNPNNLSGTNFNPHNGALYIGELQYALNQPSDGEMDTGRSNGLQAPTRSASGITTAASRIRTRAPTGCRSRIPRRTATRSASRQPQLLRGGRPDDLAPDPTGPRSLGVFARVMGAPGDRNLVSFSANAGSC